MLEQVFRKANAAGRAAFVPYVMAGDPTLETSEAIVAALSEAGADAIELGIPYGDPLADGATIAAAAQRALARGTRLRDGLASVRRLRAGGCAPIVLFTYYNPIDRYGIERFAREAAGAGASGVIVPDVTFEETGQLRQTLAAHGLQMPLLVAPTTPCERAARIAEAAGGFVYAVSRLGVTGREAAPNAGALRAQLAALRDVTDKPLAVGFGIGSPEQVRQAASMADGVIVGSAIIDAYAGSPEPVRRALEFVLPLMAALQQKEHAGTDADADQRNDGRSAAVTERERPEQP